MTFFDIIRRIVSLGKLFFSWVLSYRVLFMGVGAVATRTFAPAQKNHTYAILIAARNEEAVLGNLIDSIREQNYPKDKYDIFVVADNCTDGTARIARERGAICYERFDSAHRTKGFALQYLTECIRGDRGIDAYDAYILFDADNLLAPDYLRYMNDAFDAGEKIVTSYRNTKNFSHNWISASYGIHWLRTVRNEHRARSLFHLATRVQGTGVLFANELIRDGWRWTSLTEDRAFCADAISGGYKISYQHAAVFYDEQPTDMKIAIRQRIRWSRGHIEALCEIGPKLFARIFVTRGMASVHETEEISKGKRLLNNIRFRFMAFDMLTLFFDVIFSVSLPIITVLSLFGGMDVFLGAMKAALLSLLTTALLNMATAAYIFLIEQKRLRKMPFLKKLGFVLLFPIFDLIGIPSTLIALASRVEWKEIPHKANVKIADLLAPNEAQRDREEA